MNRALHLALAVLLLVSAAAWASDKKGIGIADLNAGDRVKALNVAWYYTWKPAPIEGLPPEKFVPMVWGGNRLEKQIAEMRQRGKAPVLLGLNEPDHADQGNMSPEQAIQVWPELVSLTGRIG